MTSLAERMRSRPANKNSRADAETMKPICVFLLSTLALGGATPSNWSGGYAPCNRHPDLLNHEHVDLGVRISTANAVLGRQFERAMEFWRGIVDLEWHEVDSQDCSLQLVDGAPELFLPAGIAARSQFRIGRNFRDGSHLTPAPR